MGDLDVLHIAFLHEGLPSAQYILEEVLIHNCLIRQVVLYCKGVR